MKLPQVRRTNHTLKGWREVGTLITFEGYRPRGGGHILPERESIIPLIDKIEWSGRLWRDPEVDREDALNETIRLVRDFNGLVVTDPEMKGFILMAPNGPMTRVCLIGVTERRMGIAKALLGASPTEEMIAGTYSDNAASIGLYESLGWKETDRIRVWHR